MSEEGYLEAGGARLEYRRAGPPARSVASPTLVLLHEGLGCVRMWKDFPERLAAATGLNVFLWSRAGFGRSDPITLPRPLDYLEREVPVLNEVLDRAGIDQPILVGHSDGGTIALLYAAAFPARPAGVVTMAAHVFVEDVTVEGIGPVKRAWEEGDLRARLVRFHGDNVDGAFRGWCDTWLDPGFRDWNIEAELPAVTAPVLAMQGADDQYGTPRQVEAIVRGVCGPAEPLLLPSCGHAPHIERPDDVIAAIARFADGLPLATKREAAQAAR